MSGGKIVSLEDAAFAAAASRVSNVLRESPEFRLLAARILLLIGSGGARGPVMTDEEADAVRMLAQRSLAAEGVTV